MTRIDKVHFIDDAQDEIMLAELWMQTEGIDLSVVHHIGLNAFLDWCGKNSDDRPGLLLIDMNMPGMRGDKVLGMVLESPFASELFAGICTGSDDPADRRSAIEAGADFFAQKPLNLACLQSICGAVSGLDLQAEGGRYTLMRTKGVSHGE